MNEHKNNVGVNNSNLPPMGSMTINNNGSENTMYGNAGANNVPVMGTVSNENSTVNNNTSNIQDKYGLPPISNFTNFSNSYETPIVDNNTSVFDLMGQFESVNSNINTNSVEQVTVNPNPGVNVVSQQSSSVQNIPVTNPVVMPNLSNQIPIVEQSPMNNNQYLNNNSNQISVLNANVDGNNIQKGFSNGTLINNNIPVSNQNNISMPNIPVLNQNSVNNNQANNTESLNMFSGVKSINQDNQSQQSSNVNYVETTVPQTPINVMPNNNLNNDNIAQNPANIFEGIVTDNQENVDSSIAPVSSVNPLSTNNPPVNNNQFSAPVTNNIKNIPNSSDINSLENMINATDTSITAFEQSNDVNNVNNSFESQDEVNNIEKPIEIPTTSITDIENNVDSTLNNNDMDKQITTFNTNIDSIDNQPKNDKKSVKKGEKTKKKKKHKFLFVILLIFIILILAAGAVFGYFMFFKPDKLVCNMQDYSSEEYLIEESFVYRFKGNNITSGKRSQSVMFTEDNIDKKNSYLEELKNQYQGLGFNVSFVENETGFDINMDFTKSELESWYGQKFNHYSKSKLKKEMRESGYTCK